MSVVLWVWRHHVLSPWLEDSIEEAVSTAYAINEGDDGVIECIEAAGGVILDMVAIRTHDAWREHEALDLEWAPTEPMTHRVQVRDREGVWRTYSSFPNEGAADSQATEFVDILTPERVRVLPL